MSADQQKLRVRASFLKSVSTDAAVHAAGEILTCLLLKGGGLLEARSIKSFLIVHLLESMFWYSKGKHA